MFLDSASISKKEFMKYIFILRGFRKTQRNIKVFRSTWIVQFSHEAFGSLPSEGTYYLQLQTSKYSAVSITRTSVSNFSASFARKSKYSFCLSGNLKISQGILFPLRNGGEADNIRRELVAKSYRL